MRFDDAAIKGHILQVERNLKESMIQEEMLRWPDQDFTFQKIDFHECVILIEV